MKQKAIRAASAFTRIEMVVVICLMPITDIPQQMAKATMSLSRSPALLRGR
jgi:competence protein ComGC